MLDYQDSDARKNLWFNWSIELQEFQVFGRDQDGRYQASSYGEIGVSISRRNNKNSQIWSSGKSVFQCKSQKPQQNH